ncbi:MAG: hypothetical protein AMXMBFR8_16050, partial [Nevskiales bacterium]
SRGRRAARLPVAAAALRAGRVAAEPAGGADRCTAAGRGAPRADAQPGRAG